MDIIKLKDCTVTNIDSDITKYEARYYYEIDENLQRERMDRISKITAKDLQILSDLGYGQQKIADILCISLMMGYYFL